MTILRHSNHLPKQNPRILVTGADGFIGTGIVQRLFPKSHVTCTSRNIAKKDYPNYIVHDWKFSLDKIGDFDAVVHCAFSGNANAQELNENELISKNVLHAAQVCNAKHVFLLSSGSVYSHSQRPITENCTNFSDTDYASSNLKIERMFQNHWKGGLTSIRLFYPFGKQQNPERLIRRLIEKICHQQTIFLHVNDSGEVIPKINPIYITDASIILGELIFKKMEICSTSHDVFNLGGSETIDIRQISDAIGSRLGLLPVYDKFNGQIHPSSNLIGESQKIYDFTSCSPTVKIKEALSLVVQDFLLTK